MYVDGLYMCVKCRINNVFQAPSTVRDILVTFYKVSFRNQVYRKRSNAVGRFNVSERLSKSRWKMYSYAKALRERNEISDAFTYNGKVYIKLRSTKGNTKPTMEVKSIQDIQHRLGKTESEVCNNFHTYDKCSRGIFEFDFIVVFSCDL